MVARKTTALDAVDPLASGDYFMVVRPGETLAVDRNKKAEIAVVKAGLNDAVGKGRRVLHGQEAGSAHTGTTAETVLRTISIPAGSMGARGRVICEFKISRTGSGGSSTIRVRFGGIGGDIMFSVSLSAANATGIYRVTIENQNSASSQVGGGAATTAFGNSTTAIYTGTQNTGSAVDLVITSELVNSGDTMTLTRSDVEVVYWT